MSDGIRDAIQHAGRHLRGRVLPLRRGTSETPSAQTVELFGHTAPNCKKPKVPLEERKCHKCGQPGHISAKCTENGRPRPTVAGVSTAAQASHVKAIMDQICCHVDADGFAPARRTFKPKPKSVTFEDLPVNTRIPQGIAKRGGAALNRFLL